LTPTKFLIGQFALTLVLILISTWAATQWTAEALGFQPRLGPAWKHIGEYPVYLPWRFFQWWYAYDAYAPDLFARGGVIASTGGLAGMVMAVIASIHRARQDKVSVTYGSARWASLRDIKRSGLLNGEGLVLGRVGRHYLRHSAASHAIAFAPTRSGKGVGLVVPTLLSWTGSAIIHDIKGENWQLTSKWRARFSRCIRFDPTSASSARFNPLLEVRPGHQDVRDVQNIADILVDPEGALERRNHWDKTAHSLLVGAILHVIYAGTDKTLAGVASLLSDPERSIDETLEDMLAANHLGTKDAPLTHTVVAEAARELLNKSENEKSSVVSTAVSFLALYRDPVVRNATSASDWSLEDLLPGADPVSLYLVVPPSDLSRTRPLIRLILNQLARRLCEVMPSPAHAKRPTLLMLDEFPALGRLDFFETSLAFLAGYGVRAFLIAQSLNQVEKAYGEKNAILDNCHVKIAFATNDERTARRISDMLGSKTEQRHQRNYAGHRLAPWLSQVMVSQQETQRPLMTPGEVMQMNARDALVMIASMPPIRAKKLRYYKDHNFITRTGSVPVPEGADISLQARSPVTRIEGSDSYGGSRSRVREPYQADPEITPSTDDPASPSTSLHEPKPNIREQIARYFLQIGDRGIPD
jgi:type IV secretion system protein VirD4